MPRRPLRQRSAVRSLLVTSVPSSLSSPPPQQETFPSSAACTPTDSSNKNKNSTAVASTAADTPETIPRLLPRSLFVRRVGLIVLLLFLLSLVTLSLVQQPPTILPRSISRGSGAKNRGRPSSLSFSWGTSSTNKACHRPGWFSSWNARRYPSALSSNNGQGSDTMAFSSLVMSKSLQDFVQEQHEQRTRSTGAKTDNDPNKRRRRGPSPLHYVVGNEAGDADSIVSALALAYIETVTGNHTLPQTPILALPRSDWILRPETRLLFQLAGLRQDGQKGDAYDLTDHLLFADDVLIGAQRRQEQSQNDNDSGDNDEVVRFTLVDHNRLADAYREQFRNSWRVIEILDHHFDQGEHTDPVPDSARIIAFDADTQHALVASTCTLVVERLLQRLQQERREQELCSGGTGGEVVIPTATDSAKQSGSALAQKDIPASLGLLLLGVILIDSVNMSKAAGKGTARDAAAITALLEHTDWDNLPSSTVQLLNMETAASDPGDQMTTIARTRSRPDTQILFDLLQKAKFDEMFWKSLSVHDALRLDYKRFSTGTVPSSFSFGASTVLLSMSDFLAKDKNTKDTANNSLLRDIHAYMRQVDIDLLGILLTTSGAGGSDGKAGDKHRSNNAESIRLRRQLILVGREGFAVDDLCQFLVHETSLELNSVPLTDVDDDASSSLVDAVKNKNDKNQLTLRLFEQGNVKASRKVVAPIMLQYFEEKAQEPPAVVPVVPK